ncbi:PREDICTED: testis-expressed sequence 264 protein, partial [Nanorana parkeri]|uniref:testis-expressed sequence 264 protein n=1 Tax=Nanorana parkeri TaxID=125878 RepID=UPI00085465D8
ERKLCAHPYVEIYKGDKIIFMCPLSRQDDFYVPEMKELMRKERGEPAPPEITDSELDPLLLEEKLSLELVSENQEAKESEPSQQKDQTDGEKSPSESGASASSFEELDLDGHAAAAKSQPDNQTAWSKMPETWDKESPEE